MDNFILPSLPLLFLYAETHFRFFRGFPSLLYRHQPEIIFDLPRRIETGSKLPVMLLLNDIDKFPAEVTEINISATRKGQSKIIFSTSSPRNFIIDHPLAFQSTVFLFYVDTTQYPAGDLSINATAQVKIKGRNHLIINDNTPTSSKYAYTCSICDDPLPGAHYCSFGDVHVHSQYSQSHVEFGPPVSIIALFAKEYGLDFVGITDHSYDLCCAMKNYLKIDPNLSRWHDQKKNIASLHNTFTILGGEEISALNGRNRVVHLGGLGLHEYIPGSLDGARHNRGRQKSLHVCEAVGGIRSQRGISFAAHPGSKAGILQRFFLKRGNWQLSDIPDQLDAFQVVNSGFSKSWYIGRNLWIRALLNGRRLALLAGNDAHGDFNRYRAIGTPFISVHESFDRYLCFARTGIYGKPTDQPGILQGIRDGKTFVTTGPFLTISSSDRIEDTVIGSFSQATILHVIGQSSKEFGYPVALRVFRGDLRLKREKMILYTPLKANTLEASSQIRLQGNQPRAGYIRAELVCRKENGEETMAATSPTFI
ncbi:MAG: hypothetical protein ACLFSB_03225 [Chitinispirillaceae bacterium]